MLIFYSTDWQAFFFMGQIANILGFADHMVAAMSSHSSPSLSLSSSASLSFSLFFFISHLLKWNKVLLAHGCAVVRGQI